MGAGVADGAFQSAGRIDQGAIPNVGVDEANEIRSLIEGARECRPEPRGDELCDFINLAVVHAHGAADVANRGLGPHGSEGNDLGYVAFAVPFGGPLDHLAASIVLKVEVDVRHLAAFQVQEALEHEAGLNRVDVRDAQRVENQARGSTAPHSHEYSVVVSEIPDVFGGEEVVGESGLVDYFELVCEALLDLIGHVRIAPWQAFAAETGDIFD